MRAQGEHLPSVTLVGDPCAQPGCSGPAWVSEQFGMEIAFSQSRQKPFPSCPGLSTRIY